MAVGNVRRGREKTVSIAGGCRALKLVAEERKDVVGAARKIR